MNFIGSRRVFESRIIPLVDLPGENIQTFRRLTRLVISAAWLLSIASGQAIGAQGTSTEVKGATYTYFIAADKVDWNYAPAEIDHMSGNSSDDQALIFVENNASNIGRVYRKAVYRGYTDDSFTQFQDVEGESVNVSFSAANIGENINEYLFCKASGLKMKQRTKAAATPPEWGSCVRLTGTLTLECGCSTVTSKPISPPACTDITWSSRRGDEPEEEIAARSVAWAVAITKRCS